MLGGQLLPGLPFLIGFTPKSPRLALRLRALRRDVTARLSGLHGAVVAQLSPRAAFAIGWPCFLPLLLLPRALRRRLGWKEPTCYARRLAGTPPDAAAS